MAGVMVPMLVIPALGEAEDPGNSLASLSSLTRGLYANEKPGSKKVNAISKDDTRVILWPSHTTDHLRSHTHKSM